jgi:hypothetical protein
VQGEFTNEILETTVDPIFTGHEHKDGTHSSFQNVVGKFTSHAMQKPQNQKTVFYSG